MSTPTPDLAPRQAAPASTPSLPPEIILLILPLLTQAALAACARTCHLWRTMCTPELYAHLTLELDATPVITGETERVVLPAPWDRLVCTEGGEGERVEKREGESSLTRESTCLVSQSKSNHTSVNKTKALLRTHSTQDPALTGAPISPSSHPPHLTSLAHCRHLLLPSHHWRICHPSALPHLSHPLSTHLPALRTLTYRVTAKTYHWPASCSLLPLLRPRVLRVEVGRELAQRGWVAALHCVFGPGYARRLGSGEGQTRMPSSVQRVECVMAEGCVRDVRGAWRAPGRGVGNVDRGGAEAEVKVLHPEGVREVVIELLRPEGGDGGGQGSGMVACEDEVVSVQKRAERLFLALKPLVAIDGPSVSVQRGGHDFVGEVGGAGIVREVVLDPRMADGESITALAVFLSNSSSL